ncbi:MAG: hypothetical protein R3F60_31450 [bacterium]
MELADRLVPVEDAEISKEFEKIWPSGGASRPTPRRSSPRWS